MIKVFVNNEASIDRTVLVDLLFDDLRIGQDLNGGQAGPVGLAGPIGKETKFGIFASFS
jgi:hypothetical protein